MPKKIAIFFRLPGAMDLPLRKPDYWASYSELIAEIRKLGGDPYIVRGQSSYNGNGTFNRSWQLNDGKVVETGPVQVDVIFNKGNFVSDHTVPVFNDEKIEDLCLNKWTMYLAMKQFCPKTMYIENEEALPAALQQFDADRVVYKPLMGSEGHGVVIGPKEAMFHPEKPLQFPGVLQEFLDTSGGIPGIVEGHHDLRVALFDGEILYSYFRTPPAGKFLANVAQGGRFEMVDPSILPEEVVQISKRIDDKLVNIPHRFYSVDFGYTKDGPKIIEMNSELGLLPNKDDPVFKKLKEKLATVLMEL